MIKVMFIDGPLDGVCRDWPTDEAPDYLTFMIASEHLSGAGSERYGRIGSDGDGKYFYALAKDVDE